MFYYIVEHYFGEYPENPWESVPGLFEQWRDSIDFFLFSYFSQLICHFRPF